MAEVVKLIFVYEDTVEKLLTKTSDVIKELRANSIQDVVISYDGEGYWVASVYYND
jgi:hypothetical protein